MLALLTLAGAPSRSQNVPTPLQSDAARARLKRDPGEPRLLAHLQDARLTELSGLAASRRFAGWAWGHNDSGDTARLFLLDAQARTRLVVNVLNAQAVDWEDIAVAGSGDEATVIAGDIGDNNSVRPGIALYRFRERDLKVPSLDLKAAPPAQAPEVSIQAQSLKLRYPQPDGAQNAESLAANARGDLLIVTKSTGPSNFYLTRWTRDEGSADKVLKKVASHQFGSTQPGQRRVRRMLATGADLSLDERRLALVTYAELYIWNLPPGSWDKLNWQALIDGPAQTRPLPPMQQSESVAWMSPSEVWVSSEGVGAPLWDIPVGTK